MKNSSNNRIEILKGYLADDPDDVFSNYALALEYMNSGENNPAIEMLERILEKDEHYLAAYYQLGKLYEGMARMKDAKMIYQKGIRIALNQKNQRTLNELQGACDSLDEDE